VFFHSGLAYSIGTSSGRSVMTVSTLRRDRVPFWELTEMGEERRPGAELRGNFCVRATKAARFFPGQV
jgi:hypothetical protein